MQVLYIDDDPLLRGLIREMLESEGHRVEVVNGGQAGLEVFRRAGERGKPFDLVITDLGMPHMDGREVTRAVKRQSPTMPVILLTGWGMRLRDEGAIPPQVDAILAKPPRLRDLRDALAQVTQTIRSP